MNTVISLHYAKRTHRLCSTNPTQNIHQPKQKTARRLSNSSPLNTLAYTSTNLQAVLGSL